MNIEDYISEIKDEPYEELIGRRNALMLDIERYEEKLFEFGRVEDSDLYDEPYQLDLARMSALCELMRERHSKMVSEL